MFGRSLTADGGNGKWERRLRKVFRWKSHLGFRGRSYIKLKFLALYQIGEVFKMVLFVWLLIELEMG